MSRAFLIGLLSVLVGPLLDCSSSVGQEFQIQIPPNAPPEVRQQIMEQMKVRRMGRPPAGPPKKEEKKQGPPQDKDKKPEDGKKKNDEKSSTVKRPDRPKRAANAEELKVRPNEKGLISFQFQGQPWPALIDWYGDISRHSIDWRELPSDHLNIRTQREYSVEETGDLLNRHLLARGFTMLQDGEFITIEKTEDINTALVPRVAPTELAGLMPHSFVKTSFRLQRIMAEDAVKELEAMKSKNGKLVALTSTNRIEAMDAVKNLRQIHDVLEQEQDSGHRALQEFKLDYVRAKDVREKLEELLGIQKQKNNAPITPQQMQQMAQMRSRQQPQQPKGPPPAEAKKEPTISFVINERRNSIIAQAPPNKMYIIEEAIELLDVESNRGGSLESYLGRIRTYRLETLDPEEVVNILFETGGLDPSTTLRVDEDSKAIIASAPPWDHLVIEKLVDKLDGSARQFKVVRLRRRRADQVATTIETLMVGKKEDEGNSRRRYPYWYGGYQEEEEDDGFRVGADIGENWLLLWCNEGEYEEVMVLLQELGEIRPQYAGSNQVRVLEALPGEDQDAFLRRVRKAFQEMAPNPVELPEQIDSILDSKPDDDVSPIKEAHERHAGQEDVTAAARTARPGPPYGTLFTQILRDANPAESSPRPFRKRAAGPAPIRVERDAQGRLIVRSTDTAALDLFTDLVDQMTPRKADYKIFKVQYVSATWVAGQLEDFFDDEEEDGNRRYPFFFFFDDDRGSTDKSQGLGDQRKVKFISDYESGTILVRNATEEQLATIQDLIDLYDVPEPVNSEAARHTKTIKVKYGKARTIETTLKDVFRDLLSGNDKAFEQQDNGNDQSREGNRGSSFFSGFGNESSNSNGPKATFKGKLSFGVDESTNMLIVTTEGPKLMEIVESMITTLDEAARPTDDVRVVQLPGGTSSQSMRDVLQRMFAAGNVAQVNGQNGQDGPNKEGNGPKGGPQNQRGRGKGEAPVAVAR